MFANRIDYIYILVNSSVIFDMAEVKCFITVAPTRKYMFYYILTKQTKKKRQKTKKINIQLTIKWKVETNI